VGQPKKTNWRRKINLKIFISHKNNDSTVAIKIQQAFKEFGVDGYLDSLDAFSGDGEKLTAHIKEQLNKCSDIIVVMSETTKSSWWVPFEIGMSAQVDMPTATFLTSSVSLPDYLAYWPRLKTVNDISKYVAVRNRIVRSDSLLENYSAIKKFNTSEFYRQLKTEL
jgi:hypothetical protein